MDHVQTALRCYERAFNQDFTRTCDFQANMNQELVNMQKELHQANDLTIDQQFIVASLSMEVYLIYHGMIGPFVSNKITTIFRDEIEKTYQNVKQKCSDVEPRALLDALHYLVLDVFSAPPLNPFDPDALFRENPTFKQHIEVFHEKIQLVSEELRDFLMLIGKFYYDIHKDEPNAGEAWRRAKEFWQKKLHVTIGVPFWHSLAFNVHDMITPLTEYSESTKD